METQRALIIVDVQPTFCEGGALGVDGGNAVAERIADFVTEHADDYSYIVTTQDWHVNPGKHFAEEPDFVDTWPPHGVAGTAEAELHEAIAALPLDESVKKGEYQAAYSGFEGTSVDGEPLEVLLREQEITAVDVVGIAESHCVKATALDSLKAGFPTRVLSDLTVPVTEELGILARQEMDEAGVEQIRSTQAFGFYDDDEDEISRIADEWVEAHARTEADWDSTPSDSWDDDTWNDTDGDGIPDDLEDDEYGAADYRDFELPDESDGGVIRTAPVYDDFQDEDGSEFNDSDRFDEITAKLTSDVDIDDLDLDEFDIDIDEDIDFSDEVDEADFDFSDIDFKPGQ
ncbi:isochorismatase family protein [Arcanobacterium phocisimile]|uniref:nicotinamidase n=1 Tax=Arcanobacterium phocisimile TaxID=1302235 RepID=A0ABX7IFS2_9ACTO|nr:isochorismatase family protein [Arcanobacterium phocisimile]QRV01984.1 isochorismatase family protein [Arcanobacterium phocisimile]